MGEAGFYHVKNPDLRLLLKPEKTGPHGAHLSQGSSGLPASASPDPGPSVPCCPRCPRPCSWPRPSFPPPVWYLSVALRESRLAVSSPNGSCRKPPRVGIATCKLNKRLKTRIAGPSPPGNPHTPPPPAKLLIQRLGRRQGPHQLCEQKEFPNCHLQGLP